MQKRFLNRETVAFPSDTEYDGSVSEEDPNYDVYGARRGAKYAVVRLRTASKPPLTSLAESFGPRSEDSPM